MPAPSLQVQSNPTTATDIITYIGIPLAVLGVLPILYTLIRSILTLRSVRRTLVHHGHIPSTGRGSARDCCRPEEGFTIRSSPMSSLIEVELPRYTIAPLDRGDAQYWSTSAIAADAASMRLTRAESTLSMLESGLVNGFLRGGSWRTFHWRRLVVGRKMYRIQYEDELREPAAEIDLSDLVHFLMDWGAVPVWAGWEKLRVGGLWTPGGTVLLIRAGSDGELKETSEARGGDWVLKTTVPDESDGILSLAVRWVDWGSSGDSRGQNSDRSSESLPPGWARLRQSAQVKSSGDSVPSTLVDRISKGKSQDTLPIASESVRFCIEDNTRVSRVLVEHNSIETGQHLDLWRSAPFQETTGQGSLWFTCAAAALSRQTQLGSGLWTFDIPRSIVDTVSKNIVPTGVLVMLGITTEARSGWSHRDSVDGAVDPNNNPALRHQRRFLERQRRMAEERSMPPAQAQIARQNRETEERLALHDDMLADARLRQEREDARIKDAIDSTKLGNKVLAEACLAWLVDQGEITKGQSTVETLAEAVLYLIIIDQQPRQHNEDSQSEAARIISILDEWSSWTTQGTMKKTNVAYLRNKRKEFCFAAVLVKVIDDAAGSQSVQSGEAMKECIRQWKRVRLG